MNVPPILLPPGQMKPGNRIRWTTWTTSAGDGNPGVREGNVWSRGPEPGTLWVVPDSEPGDRKPVLVGWRRRRYVQAPAALQGGAA